MAFWNKKNTNSDQNEIKENIGGTSIKLNLSKDESLEALDLRKKEVVTLCLEKPELTNLKSRVALVLDYSGSMGPLYRNGTVQSVVERILPIAMQFDDNAELDLWIFENGYRRLDGITKDNFYGYVKNEIMSKYSMGGTNYSPVMKDIAKKYIQEEPSSIPNYVIYITDGDNSDKTATTEFIKNISKEPIFWQFVGLGGDSFAYLEKLDDMGGRYVDNADFFKIKDINKVSDKELYNNLLNEYPEWLKTIKSKGMIK